MTFKSGMELFLEMIPPGSLCNPDTHSNIFGSFVRIFQFSEKYCSLPASGKFPFSPFGKRVCTKGSTCFNWYSGTVSGKCVFGRGEVMLRKVSLFFEETLTSWSFWLPWFLRLEMIKMMMLIDLYWTLTLKIRIPLPHFASAMRGSFDRAFCHCSSHDSSVILCWTLSLPSASKMTCQKVIWNPLREQRFGFLNCS